MPPAPPNYRIAARRRMRQGLHPASVAARDNFLANRQTPVFAPGDETVRLSTGREVNRAVVDRVKERWLAALKMAAQMDAPPPGQPGGPPDSRFPTGWRAPTSGAFGPRGVPGATRTPGVTFTNSVPGMDPAGVRPAAPAVPGPNVTPGLARFLAQMAARRRR